MSILISPMRGRGKYVDTSTTMISKLGADTVLKFDLIENEDTYDVIRGIRKRWSVSRVEGPKDKKEYVVFLIDRQTHGKNQRVSVSCRYKPLDIIKRYRVYESIEGSFTAENFLKIIFKGTGLKYKITKPLGSSRFESAGEGESVEELIKKFTEHFDVEFEIEYDDKKDEYIFVFAPYLSKKADYHIDDEINANNMKIEEDSGDMYTYAVGYGDYDDDEGIENPGFIVKFEHPNMKDVGRYDAPPIKDGRIKDPELMQDKLRTLIESSVKTSISLDFIVLNDRYPNAIAKVSQTVHIRHAILGLNVFVRIVEVTCVRDKDNIIVSQDVVLGDFKRSDRYRKRVSEAASAVGGLGGKSNFVKNYKRTTSRSSAAIRTNQKLIDDISVASDEKDGLMSSEDKKKLDQITNIALKAKKSDGTSVDLTKAEIIVDKDGNLKLK